MTAYAWDGTEWQECEPFAWDGSEFSSADRSLYAWDGTDWQEIWPPASSSLLPPENLAAANVDHNSADISWTNPTQTGSDPTHVQIRLAELGAVWTEIEYPLAAWVFAALDASTLYTCQVRYIIRTLGVITATSDTKTVFFTTDAAPIGAPAPDPGGANGDTIVPFTGTTNNPGAVGGNDVCWWEWRIEILSLTDITWTTPAGPNPNTSDDGVTAIAGEIAGNDTEVSWADGTLTDGRTYRVSRREACDTDTDGIADTFGDWEYGDPFPAPVDWDAACGGFTGSVDVTDLAILGDAALAFRFPDICINDTPEMVMIEAESGVEVLKGPGFFSFFTDATGEEGAAPLTTMTTQPFYPVMAVALPTTMVAGSDWSMVHRFKALASFSGVNNRTYALFASAGSGAAGYYKIQVTESATGWTFVASILGSGGGYVTLTSSELPYDTDTHTVGVTWDADGTKTLYVDGNVEDTDTGTDIYGTPTNFAATCSVPAYLIPLQQMGWTKLLTADDMGTFTGPSGVQFAYWERAGSAAATAADASLPLSVTIPTHNSGDLLLLIVTGVSNNAASTDLPKLVELSGTGWTEVGTSGGGGLPDSKGKVFAKIGNGSTTAASLDQSSGLDWGNTGSDRGILAKCFVVKNHGLTDVTDLTFTGSTTPPSTAASAGIGYVDLHIAMGRDNTAGTIANFDDGAGQAYRLFQRSETNTGTDKAHVLSMHFYNQTETPTRPTVVFGTAFDTDFGTQIPPGSAADNALYDAIKAHGPELLVPFRESSGTTWKNYGGAGGTIAKPSSGCELAQYSFEGWGAPTFSPLPVVASAIDFGHSTEYNRDESSGGDGITIIFLYSPLDSTGATNQFRLKKGNTWEFNIQNSIVAFGNLTAGAGQQVTGLSSNTGTSLRRLVIGRQSNTLSAAAELRVNGATGAAFGTGSSTATETATVKLYSDAGTNAEIAVGLLAIIPSRLSDAECAAIETIASGKGIYW